jgi:hypothetical protein
MNKGVPILLEYKLGLWKERAGWFDRLLDDSQISYKVRYDPWEKQFSVVQIGAEVVIENILNSEREVLDLLKSSGQISLELDDTTGIYYIAGNLSIKTMSFSNYREVESWLKGELSDVSRPRLQDAPDRVSEFLFDMALKITGLKNISREFRSERFEIKDLPLLAPRQ